MSAIVVIEVLLVVALQLKHVIDRPWWWLPAQPPWLVVKSLKREVNSPFILLRKT
jgi:hypothetical protein